MSFGFSASDFVLLVQLAHRTFRNCQKAGEEYVEIACEARCLYSVLRILRTEAQNPESKIFKQDPASTKQLLATADGCRNVLDGLDFVLEKYEGLKPDGRASGGTKFWQRLRFGSKAEELGAIRGKIVTYISTISILIDTMQIRAVDRVEGKIDTGFTEMIGQFAKMRRDIYTIASDHRAKERLGAGMSSLSLSTFSADDKVVWQDFRRRLRQRGYGSQSLARHKHILIAYMIQLDESGLLEIDQSGPMPPLVDEQRMETQQITDSTDTPATVKVADLMVGQDMNPGDAKAPPLEHGSTSREQDSSSIIRTDTAPEELQHEHVSSSLGSCARPDSPGDKPPKPTFREVMEMNSENCVNKGVSNSSTGDVTVSESHRYSETLEKKLQRTPNQARYKWLNRSLLSACVLETRRESYTEYASHLCVHRLLSQNEIEEYIAETAICRGLSAQSILHHLFPRSYATAPPIKQTPFPLFTCALRGILSDRALQSLKKEFVKDSNLIIVFGGLQEEEIVDCIKETNKIRGPTKHLPPRFPIFDQEGNTTIVVRTYVMNGRSVSSNHYLDETPVEDVDMDHISEGPHSGLAQLISFTASLEGLQYSQGPSTICSAKAIGFNVDI